MIVYLDLVTITTIFTWIKLYTINTFCHKHPKQIFSISMSVYYFTFSYVSRFLNTWFGIPKDGSTVTSHGFHWQKNSSRGVDFCPLISISSVGTPIFYFISWVYIYWITSVQTFTKIWVLVLFGWNDLKQSETIVLLNSLDEWTRNRACVCVFVCFIAHMINNKENTLGTSSASFTSYSITPKYFLRFYYSNVFLIVHFPFKEVQLWHDLLNSA